MKSAVIFCLVLSLVTSNVTGLKPLQEVVTELESSATGNRKLLQVKTNFPPFSLNFSLTHVTLTSTKT